MDKKLSIESIILNSDDDSGAKLCHDILLWSIPEGNKPTPFRFTEIGNWLIEHYRPFREKYANSHIPRTYRLHSNRDFIQRRIDNLIDLRLINKHGSVKSRKNNTDTPTYSFTEDGIYFAWLIKARNSKGKDRLNSIEMIFNKLMSNLSLNDSSFTLFIMKLLTKCKDKGIFPNLIDDEKLILVGGSLLDTSSTFLRRLLSSQARKFFVETIKELDRNTQKLFLFQFKLDIETRFAEYFINAEWEVMRYDKIHDPAKLTVQGYCETCGLYPIQLDVFKFLSSPMHYTLNPDTKRWLSLKKMDCQRCHKPDSFEILPTWYHKDTLAN
jgi:hypothetical protein